MSSRGEILIAIMNNPLDLSIARDQHWYRIPVSSAHKWIRERWPPDWLAFYQTKAFNDEAHAVNYYARVLDIRQAYRWQLLPNEPRDQRSERRYFLDFAIHCASGKIDAETDGDTWHADPARIPLDNQRDNDLETVGWRVLRFNTLQIREEIEAYCVPTVIKNINRLGGVDEGGWVPRRVNLGAPGGLQQMGLFDDLDPG